MVACLNMPSLTRYVQKSDWLAVVLLLLLEQYIVKDCMEANI